MFYVHTESILKVSDGCLIIGKLFRIEVAIRKEIDKIQTKLT